MPRKQRFAKRCTEVTQNQIHHLITGYDFFGGGFTNEEAMRAAWLNNRAVVLQRAAEDPLRCAQPIYALLRFDQNKSREAALAARSAAGQRQHDESQRRRANA